MVYKSSISEEKSLIANIVWKEINILHVFLGHYAFMNHGTVSNFYKTSCRFCEFYICTWFFRNNMNRTGSKCIYIYISNWWCQVAHKNMPRGIGFLMEKVMSFSTPCDQLHYHSQALCRVPSVCEWCSFTTKSVCLRNVMFERTVGQY